MDMLKGQTYASVIIWILFLIWETNYNLLPGFLKLEELSGLSVSVIFISDIIFEKY